VVQLARRSDLGNAAETTSLIFEDLVSAPEERRHPTTMELGRLGNVRHISRAEIMDKGIAQDASGPTTSWSVWKQSLLVEVGKDPNDVVRCNW
jgi:hypothetical protein